jgi:Arc/MetJ-type ribon-helix-helix transcriptional regulator
MSKYSEKKSMRHINIFVPDSLWEEVKSKVGYGMMSEFVRDCISEKLEKMEEEEAAERRFPTIGGEEINEN